VGTIAAEIEQELMKIMGYLRRTAQDCSTTSGSIEIGPSSPAGPTARAYSRGIIAVANASRDLDK
jgi:hypothetical protein